MSFSTSLCEENRSALHLTCSRVLMVAVFLGAVGLASQHWLAAPRGPPPSSPGAVAVAVAVQEEEEEEEVGGVDGGVPSRLDGGVPSWSVKHLGLWSVCNNVSRCASLPSPEFPDAYGPVRGLAVTSLFLHALSVLVGLTCSCEDPDTLMGHFCLARLEEILAVVAALVMGGTLTIFAQTTQRHPLYRSFHFSWSFWLLVSYMGLVFLAGLVIVFSRSRHACRKLRTRFRFRRHQQTEERTTRCLPDLFKHSPESLGADPEADSDGQPLKKKEEEEEGEKKKKTGLDVFVESVKEEMGLVARRLEGWRTGKTSSVVGRNLQGSQLVYSSLEGLPRALETQTQL
ncbi:uncharacterized protein LOC143300726 [Babylonia areolata]|uniref:uncharacterized protein LOC143300726 n=1 Tax=Babylonia areolata TaxID=304850 RepID=UPI003FD56800